MSFSYFFLGISCGSSVGPNPKSSGQSFIQSIRCHILRNYVFLYAIEQDKPLPIGTQDASALDSRIYDGDADVADMTANMFEYGEAWERIENEDAAPFTEKDFESRSAEIYSQYGNHFKWLRPSLFVNELARDLRSDAKALLDILVFTQYADIWKGSLSNWASPD